MIRHIVMWTLMDSAEGNDKATNAAILEKKLYALKELLPQVKGLQFGNGLKSGDGIYDVVAIIDFEDEAALNEYAVHPDHVAVSDFCKKIRTGRAVIDFKY